MRKHLFFWSLGLLLVNLFVLSCSEDSNHSTSPSATSPLFRPASSLVGVWEGTYTVVWIDENGAEEKRTIPIVLSVADDTTYSWEVPSEYGFMHGIGHGSGKYIRNQSTLSFINMSPYLAIYDLRWLFEADLRVAPDGTQYQYKYMLKNGKLYLSQPKPERFSWKSATLHRVSRGVE